MRGTSKKAFMYILDDDRDSPKDEQTIFWLKPWGGLSGARIASRYANTERVGRKGYNEVNVGKRRKADEESWLEIVDKIENFAFSDDYPQFQNGKYTDENGFVKEISDKEMLLAVANDITLDQFNEIVEAAANAGTVSEAQKKK